MEFFLLDLIALGCISGIMATALNLQYGYTGILNFAFYTFTAIGAYVAGITTMGRPTYGSTYIIGWQLPWYVGTLLGGLVAAAVGIAWFALISNRLRSDYQAIVVVAGAYVFYNLANNDTTLLNGATGLFGAPSIFGGLHISETRYTVLMIATAAPVLALFVVIAALIFRSPYGRLLRAIREDDSVALAFGRNTWAPKLVVSGLACFMGGVAGALLLYYISSWSPYAFEPAESFVLLAAVIIGGSGSYWGSLLGAFVVVEALTELTRYVPNFGYPQDVGAARAILIGLVLILMLKFRPDGLLPEGWLRWPRGQSASTAGSNRLADSRGSAE